MEHPSQTRQTTRLHPQPRTRRYRRRRVSADGDLLINCGKIVAALTPEGEREIQRMMGRSPA